MKKNTFVDFHKNDIKYKATYYMISRIADNAVKDFSAGLFKQFPFC